MPQQLQFDPLLHLCYNNIPPKRTTLADIGYPSPPNICDVAFTSAFPLLTPSAVKLLRAELLHSSVKIRHGPFVRSVPGLASFQVRGYSGVSDLGSFTKQVWSDPSTLQAISHAGGIDLVPVMDYEIANVNVQLTYGENTLDILTPEPLASDKSSTLNGFENSDEETMKTPVINWHRDSYGWTCIVMLSDPTNMKYGDIMIKTGGGKVISVPAVPKMGYAMLLQGGRITHLARRGIGVPERVTMVPSFRPKDPLANDESTLINSRKISNLNRLFYEWTTYRLELLSERFRLHAQSMRLELEKRSEPEKSQWAQPIVDVTEFGKWIEDQMSYLKFTFTQMQYSK